MPPEVLRDLFLQVFREWKSGAQNYLGYMVVHKDSDGNASLVKFYGRAQEDEKQAKKLRKRGQLVNDWELKALLEAIIGHAVLYCDEENLADIDGQYVPPRERQILDPVALSQKLEGVGDNRCLDADRAEAVLREMKHKPVAEVAEGRHSNWAKSDQVLRWRTRLLHWSLRKELQKLLGEMFAGAQVIEWRSTVVDAPPRYSQ